MTTLQFCPTVLACTSPHQSSLIFFLLHAHQSYHTLRWLHPVPTSSVSNQSYLVLLPLYPYSPLMLVLSTLVPLRTHPSLTPFPVPPYSPSYSRYTHNTLSRYSSPIFSQLVVSRPIPTTSTLLFHINPIPPYLQYVYTPLTHQSSPTLPTTSTFLFHINPVLPSSHSTHTPVPHYSHDTHTPLSL
jgi:hypothetical protein